MASCSACGTTILFGGKRLGDLRFCSDKCLARGRHLAVAGQIPDAVVADLARRVHSGRCPKCNGPGPSMSITRTPSGPRCTSRLGRRSQTSRVDRADRRRRSAPCFRAWSWDGGGSPGAS